MNLHDGRILKYYANIFKPVNRYEINFINTVSEGVELMKKVDMPNMKLMPDVFHMHIEDLAIGPELERNMDYINYMHLADSNRLASFHKQ